MNGPEMHKWADPVSVRATAVVTLADGATVLVETCELDLRKINHPGSDDRLVHGAERPGETLDQNLTLDLSLPAHPTDDTGYLYKMTWTPPPVPAWQNGDVVLGDYTYVRDGKRWQAYDKGNRVGRLFRDEHMDYLIRDRGLRIVKRAGEFQ